MQRCKGQRCKHTIWAQMVGGTLPSSWKKNILEIVLEKDDRGPFSVSDTDCSHLLVKLGIDPRSSVQIESVQICPTGRGVILVTFKQGLDIERFSRYDVIEVTRTGIRAVHVKPAGKKDVVVTIKGLHPNTRDDGVLNYLGKYGKIVTNKVVYGTFGEGPLKGIKNGDRSFKIELKAETNIGTYHAIDGQRVTLRYPGQLQTCARCHQTPIDCKGGAIARRCEAAQGTKVEFSEYILKLWEKIGYAPGEVEMAAVYDEDTEYEESGHNQKQIGGTFTPPQKMSEPEKFSGVSIKQIPRDTDHGDVMEFLIEAGLPDKLKECVEIKGSGVVSIKNIDNQVCMKMIKNIHNQISFGKKLFCNGLIALTPEKDSGLADTQVQAAVVPTAGPQERPSTPTLPASSPSTAGRPVRSPTRGPAQSLAPPDTQVQAAAVPTAETQERPSTPTLPASSPSTAGRPGRSPTRGPAQSLAPPELSVSTPIVSLPESSSTELTVSPFLRRYSCSLLDSPRSGSLAADILNTRKNLLSEIRDLQDQLSEFDSCRSEQSDSSGDESENKKVKQSKRKAGKTPIKSDEKNKKANLDWFEKPHDGSTH